MGSISELIVLLIVIIILLGFLYGVIRGIERYISPIPPGFKPVLAVVAFLLVCLLLIGGVTGTVHLPRLSSLNPVGAAFAADDDDRWTPPAHPIVCLLGEPIVLIRCEATPNIPGEKSVPCATQSLGAWDIIQHAIHVGCSS